jgi:signal transduction histidine kinase/integral membrane sensor domain MASE1/ActR/RegA family two-component response regulator
MSPRLRTLTAILVLAGCYFCAGKLGLSWAYVHASASAIWPASGLALAALLLWGAKLWPGIFLGAFLVNITTEGSLATTISIAAGNTLEALVGTWGINRFANGARVFERARNTFKFVWIAAILSTVISATFGVTSLTLAGFAQWNQYTAIWLTWWLGDAVGNLIVAPFLLILMTEPYPQVKPSRLIEAAGLLLSLILLGYLIFLRNAGFNAEYIMVLPLLWAAFRFGQRGAVTSALIVAVIAVIGTLSGVGPFVHPDPNESLLHLQAFMGTIAIAALVLASVVSEGRRAEQRLQVQDAISRILAESPSLRAAASQIIRVLCELAGWDWGAMWNIDRGANELYCVEAWHVPSTQMPHFETDTKFRRFTLGIGLPGRVWSSGKAAWIPDVSTDNNFPRAPLAARDGLHSAFGFPIKLGDEILGVIECFSREVREPDDHFLQMVSHIGEQVGQFMERKRAESEIATLNKTLVSDLAAMTRLQQLSTKLVQIHDMGSLMNDILDVAIEISDADMGNVQLFERESEILKIVAHRGFDDAFLEFFASADNGSTACEIVGKLGRRVIVEDVGTNPIFAGTPAREVMLSAGARSVQSTPLMTRSGRLIGIVSTHYREPHRPTERQLTLLDLLARQAADFVERSQTEELLSRNEERLRAVNEELERRVQERTADLEKANAALVKTIEEQKSLEEQLRQAQKMEIVGTLAGGIAHDFNNILNIIRGYATLIGQQSSTDHQINESLQIIEEQIKRGASVVRQLLTVARKTETHLTPTDPNELVLTFSELVKQAFPKTITVRLSLDPDLPRVLADPNQMSQTLLNICVNARDAMPRGGKLTIKTELIDETKLRERLKVDSACVCIVISDTGMGMEEGVRARIFEPFFTTKEIGQGTGLGLAIVYGIVKEHNGLVDVESEPGQGTTFRIYLPIFQSKGHSDADEMATAKAVREPANRRGTVLVVEDDEAMVYLLRKLLLASGYQMLAATDGAKAIDLYLDHKEEIDVVLLDLGLPKVPGIDVIQKLKEHNPAVKIVVATGYLEPELKSEIFRSGVKDCINKPYVVRDVLEKLGSLIQSS